MLLTIWNQRLLPVFTICLLASAFGAASTCDAAPTAIQALGLRPIQSNVDYEKPTSAEAAKCTIKAESSGGMAGWVLRDEAGRYLRRFLDTNRDNKVDMWCYYKDGVEVYRDVDKDFNGKADQYRWLGTAGIRWGLDTDEDGRIDSWKMISPEEVSAEVVVALATRDSNRFKRLLLTPEELNTIGLGEGQRKELATKISNAVSQFAAVSQRQQVVRQDSVWVNFGGNRPGVMPIGTNGSSKDVILYDNVTAVVETNGQHAQVAIGTLFRVGDNWRVVDLPSGLVDGQANNASTGFFFNATMSRPVNVDTEVEGGLSEELQELITDYEGIERQIQSAVAQTEKARLNERRAILMEKLVEKSSSAEERLNWARQYADTLSAAIQSGEYPAGADRLSKFHGTLNDEKDARIAAYIKYRIMNAEYGAKLQEPSADYAKIQEWWVGELQTFVETYPQGDDAADAMLQLALTQEFAEKDDDAKKWYQQIISNFGTSPLAKKAEGAIRRIDSVGQSVSLRGRTVEGRTLDTSGYRGKVVLIHYWATWCDHCDEEMKVLKNMQAKYGKRGFSIIGISLDSERQSLVNYVRANRVPWQQLYEEGGLDSRLANHFGISTLPAMLLIDKSGKVARRSIHAGELDETLGKMLR